MGGLRQLSRSAYRQPDIPGSSVRWAVPAHATAIYQGSWQNHRRRHRKSRDMVSPHHRGGLDPAGRGRSLRHVCFAVPCGVRLSRLGFRHDRSFTEHRWGERGSERTAVVNRTGCLVCCFLDDCHVVHHVLPTLPWWKVPQVWRENRSVFRLTMADSVFRGYGEIARRWLLTPNFIPLHPASLANRTSSNSTLGSAVTAN